MGQRCAFYCPGSSLPPTKSKIFPIAFLNYFVQYIFKDANFVSEFKPLIKLLLPDNINAATLRFYSILLIFILIWKDAFQQISKYFSGSHSSASMRWWQLQTVFTIPSSSFIVRYGMYFRSTILIMGCYYVLVL
jgi:hypothetical protein